MNIKHGLVALIAAGGTAGLLFGGSAVSTAFTAQQSGTASVSADTVSLTTSGTIDVGGLLPGGTTAPSQLTVDPSGSNTATALYLIGGNWSVVHDGSSGSPQPADLTVNVSIPTLNWSKSFNESSLMGHVIGLYSGIPAKTRPITVDVSFSLAQGAGNDWNGAEVQIPYTLHLQDISGTDNGHYIAPSNN